MNTEVSKLSWVVLPDPIWKTKHPLHEARYVATSDDVEIGSEGWRFANEDDSIICTMPDSPEQKSHARLIAAAPELLEACKEALLGLYCHCKYNGGEGDPTLRDNCECWGCQTGKQIKYAIAKATKGTL